MSNTTHALHVHRHLRLSTPSGDLLPVTTAWFWASTPATMRVLLDWKHWERVARERLFGLDADEIPTDLIPDVEVAIDARLRSDVETRFPDDEPSLRTRLADPEDPLRTTETWTAIDVRQQPRLPDEEDLTDMVFDETPEPRTHTREFEIRQTRPGTRTVERRDEPALDVGEFIGDDAGSGPAPDIAAVLEPILAALDDGGWPYEVAPDGTTVSLVATLDDREWDVVVEPAEPANRCTITSIHPDPVPEPERDVLAAQLLDYNGTVDRGGFELDAETGEVRFRTSFVPVEESVADVLGENVTAMAEWFDEVAR